MNDSQSHPDDPRTLIYLRVSTKGQDKYSPETQLKYCEDHAKEKGLEVVPDGIVRETASAYKAKNRPKYAEMIKRITAERIPHLIFYLPDRIARNYDDWIPLRNTGVRLHDAVTKDSFSPNDPRDYKKVRNFERALINATESSDDNRQRVTDAWVTQAERGRWPHNRPLGYLIGEPKMVGENKWETSTIQDPERAPKVRLLFLHVLTTGERNRSTLCRKAKDLGLRAKSGRVLLLQEVIDLLRNPFYCGRIRLKGKLYPNKGVHSPIVSEQEFREVQEILGGTRVITKGGKQGKYYGLLQCDYCGKSVILDDHSKVSKRTGEMILHKYYRCTSGKATEWYQEHFHQPRCPLYRGPYWVEKDIDDFLAQAIQDMYIDEDAYEWIQGEIETDYRNLKALNEKERASLEHEFKENERVQGQLALRLAAANPAVIKAIEGQIEHLGTRNNEIVTRLEELRNGEQAVSLDDIREVLELSKALKDNYLAASPEKRTKYNKLMFRMIRVARKGEVARAYKADPLRGKASFDIVWNEPFATLEGGWLPPGMEESWRKPKAESQPTKIPKSKGKRAWRESNPRPAA